MILCFTKISCVLEIDIATVYVKLLKAACRTAVMLLRTLDSTPVLTSERVCGCDEGRRGEGGRWMRVADIDMTNKRAVLLDLERLHHLARSCVEVKVHAAPAPFSVHMGLSIVKCVEDSLDISLDDQILF